MKHFRLPPTTWIDVTMRYFLVHRRICPATHYGLWVALAGTGYYLQQSHDISRSLYTTWLSFRLFQTLARLQKWSGSTVMPCRLLTSSITVMFDLFIVVSLVRSRTSISIYGNRTHRTSSPSFRSLCLVCCRRCPRISSLITLFFFFFFQDTRSWSPPLSLVSFFSFVVFSIHV